MVFYFESNVVSPPSLLFMGIDKYESKFIYYHSQNINKLII
jgi:hypothetical protein